MNHYRNVFALGFVFLFSFVLRAEEVVIHFSVDAGDVERINSPVVLHTTLPDSFEKHSMARVVDADGKEHLAQVTGRSLLTDGNAGANRIAAEVHFILPALAAGKSATFKAVINDKADDAMPAYHFEDSSKAKTNDDVYAEQSRELRLGDKPVMRYMHSKLDESSKDARSATFKPYHHVYDAAGKRYLTKGPGGLFPHHRGVYFGFNRISYGDGKKADTWHCNNGESQQHATVVLEEVGPILGRQRVKINWHGQKGDIFAEETRELTAYNTPGGQLLEFATVLESKVGKVRLDGDPQHAGFQWRSSQDVPDKTAKQTYYIRPDGKGKPGEFRNWSDKTPVHTNLPWNAVSIVLDDQRYTICYLDRPENPKEARFSERDYARFGSYFEYDLDEGKPLKLNYRLWVQPGEMEVAQVDRLDQDFVKEVKVTVK